MAHRNATEWKPFFDYAFAKRPAEELFDLRTDPDQMKNLAADPAHEATRKKLAEQLTKILTDAGDPRVVEKDCPLRETAVHRCPASQEVTPTGEHQECRWHRVLRISGSPTGNAAPWSWPSLPRQLDHQNLAVGFALRGGAAPSSSFVPSLLTPIE
ncbi:MAG: hypothetical protein U0792_14910 [Gemmataceae bacterium]